MNINKTSSEVECPPNYVLFYADPDHISPVCLRFLEFMENTWNMMRMICQQDGAELAHPEGWLQYQIVNYIRDHPCKLDVLKLFH